LLLAPLASLSSKPLAWQYSNVTQRPEADFNGKWGMNGGEVFSFFDLSMSQGRKTGTWEAQDAESLFFFRLIHHRGKGAKRSIGKRKTPKAFFSFRLIHATQRVVAYETNHYAETLHGRDDGLIVAKVNFAVPISAEGDDG
jgi:hypothetical protein